MIEVNCYDNNTSTYSEAWLSIESLLTESLRNSLHVDRVLLPPGDLGFGKPGTVSKDKVCIWFCPLLSAREGGLEGGFSGTAPPAEEEACFTFCMYIL